MAKINRRSGSLPNSYEPQQNQLIEILDAIGDTADAIQEHPNAQNLELDLVIGAGLEYYTRKHGVEEGVGAEAGVAFTEFLVHEFS